jgi:uncharacterized BrkB/YihY/UPF0761 family membrane protein
VEGVDRFQRNHPAAGFPLAVLYTYFDDSGGYLAALITYYGFVSLFPLLLLLTVLGWCWPAIRRCSSRCCTRRCRGSRWSVANSAT